MKILILVGPPGAGKGTQCALLTKNEGFIHLSSGNLIRDLCKQNTSEAKHLKELMGRGELVSDDFVINLIDKELKRLVVSKVERVILDGFPRTLEQAKKLSLIINKNADLNVIELSIDEEILKRRITGRFICKHCGEIYNEYFKPLKDNIRCDFCGCEEFLKREDDKIEILSERLKVYNKIVKDLREYYQEKYDILECDISEEELYQNILKIIF
jgi:adenylate kinase